MTAAVYVLAGVVGLIAGTVGVSGMLGVGMAWRLPALLPLGGVSFVLDPLAGLFLALVGFASVPASLDGLGHARRERRGRVAYLLFVAAMALVPLAANALTFLLAWELMSLASYVLVLHDGQKRESIRAAWVYAVMTHAGLACLLVGMLLLGAGTGSFDVGVWRAAAPELAPGARNLAWTLLALGFAAKAGVIPLHVWLPLAHPAAPSHVSALMSGVMIKLGVYGLVRVSLDWLGEGPAWWGAAILLAGALSAVVGVLSAIVDRDLKRVLAFSSIENAGIILIGLGAGVLYQAAGLPALAVLGVTAALYHVVNHAAFKMLLFLGAGAVVHATGTRDMEALGGLIKRMPWTAACFLTGSAAIAALPPLNGFVSEWLTFQALLQNLLIERPAVNLVFALGIAALALTGGLAVACFVRAFGISFLALPRSEAAARAHDPEAPSRLAMTMLALTCLALGVGATAVVPAIARVGDHLVGTATPLALGDALTLNVSGEFASLSMLAVAAALALAGLGVLGGLAVAGGRGRVRRYETWNCGRMLQTPRMEYTATAFANPFKRVFDFFYRPVEQIDIAAHPSSRLFVQKIEYANPTRSLFDDWLYRPLLDAVHRGARVVRVLQSGSANLYLAYILLALLALLVLA
jgi:formate hydrogenlyase subunit 3/multisubunit Na+/H+ antiporter MnhD subunit